MFLPQANNRRSSNSVNPANFDRRRQPNKAIYAATQGDSILRITMFGAMILVLLMAIFSGSAYANAGETGVETDSQGPASLVNHATENMLAALKKDKDIIEQNPAHVYTLASNIVLPHFDFKSMSALALGKHWRRASAQQKQRFPEEFRSLLLRTYATALSEYTNEKVVYLPLRGDVSSGDVSVQTEIQRDAGPAIPVSYSLHKKAGDWKVYDIKIDGISLVANYRSSFSSQIRRGGIDKLIDALASKNAKVASLQ